MPRVDCQQGTVTHHTSQRPAFVLHLAADTTLDHVHSIPADVIHARGAALLAACVWGSPWVCGGHCPQLSCWHCCPWLQASARLESVPSTSYCAYLAQTATKGSRPCLWTTPVQISLLKTLLICVIDGLACAGQKKFKTYYYAQ